MEFKAGKSRSLIILKGYLQKKQTLTLGSQRIPTITEKPIKCLGKYYDYSLRDCNQIKDVSVKLKDWLRLIEDSNLPGRYKVWCFQFVLLPKLLWPLLMYAYFNHGEYGKNPSASI